MIEYVILAVFATAVITYVMLELYPRKLSADAVIRRAKNTLELEKKIPDLMKKERRQFIVMPVKTGQNVRGIVTDEQHNVYDTNSGIKRTRLTVAPLNGGKPSKEWGDFFNPMKHRLEDICMASGTAFLTLAKNPNTDDDKNNIAWHLLPPSMVQAFKRGNDERDAIYRDLKTARRQFDGVYAQNAILETKVERLERELRSSLSEFSKQSSATAAYESQVNSLKAEVARLTNENFTLNEALAEYKEMAGRPAGKALGVDDMRLNKLQNRTAEVEEVNKTLQSDKDEILSKYKDAQAEVVRLKAKLAEQSKGGGKEGGEGLEPTRV